MSLTVYLHVTAMKNSVHLLILTGGVYISFCLSRIAHVLVSLSADSLVCQRPTQTTALPKRDVVFPAQQAAQVQFKRITTSETLQNTLWRLDQRDVLPTSTSGEISCRRSENRDGHSAYTCRREWNSKYRNTATDVPSDGSHHDRHSPDDAEEGVI